MLIHGDESSKSEGVDLINHDAVGGSVASELLVRSYPLYLSLTFPCLLQLGDNLRLKAKLRQDFEVRMFKCLLPSHKSDLTSR